MDKRPIGRSGLSVAPLCFGGNVFGWTADEQTSFALLDAFTAEGFGFVDTADVYTAWIPGHQGGESEAVIGRWIKARGGRDRLTIATKVGMKMGSGAEGLRKDHIVASCEGSLKRLNTDRIDLYYAHRDDEGTPLEETLEAFASLVKAGKVRALGGSNYTAARLKEALATSARLGLPRYECLQPEYSLASRETYEGDLEALCRQEGLGVASYFSLAAGFLTGKYRQEGAASGRAREARVTRFLNPKGFALLEAMDGVAKELGATPTQVALAWLVARPGLTAPIASATSTAQLEDLIAGARLALPADAVARLDAASADPVGA